MKNHFARASVVALLLFVGCIGSVPYADAQPTQVSCADLLQRFTEQVKVRIDAGKNLADHIAEYADDWQRVIDAGRRYLGQCPNNSFVLDQIAEGLTDQNDLEGAISILKRCVSIDSDASTCWVDLGNAEGHLCRFDEAKEAYQKVISIGGFTELKAIEVDLAKGGLKHLETLEFANAHGVNTCEDDPNKDGGSSSSKSPPTRFGSGFFVNQQGYILTNDHVVNGCKRLATREGNSLTVVDRFQESDLALLKTDAKVGEAAVFKSGPPPRAGDTVITFGFPLPGILSSQGNVSTGSLSATTGLQDDVRFIQISAPVQPGNSGGPLLDTSGHVIGVIVAKLDALKMARSTGDVPQNVNFAVSWAVVRAFLDEEGIAYNRAPSGKPLETSVITERAKQFSVAIECSE
jgi:S1-C subfamily serine protease